jgi:rare lipoprotein A
LLLHGCASATRHEPQPGLTGYKETGMASYYARKFHHRKTASGERFDNNAMTAAHKTLPFGTEVNVTNLNNGKSITVRINDRGPFVKGRIIDLSRAAFSQIEDLDRGVIKVKISVVR